MSSCQVFNVGEQTAVCTVLADQCPGLKVACGNTAAQSLVCKQDIMAKIVADTLTSTGVDFSPHLAANVSVESYVLSKCSGSGTNFQTLLTVIDCARSSRAVFNTLNSLDQATLCGVLAGADLYAAATGSLAINQGGTRVSETTAIGITVGVTLILVIVMIVAMATAKPRTKVA